MDLAIQLLTALAEPFFETTVNGESVVLRPARPCPRCLKDNLAGIIEGGGCSEYISTEMYDDLLGQMAQGRVAFSGREQPTHYRLANGEVLTREERKLAIAQMRRSTRTDGTTTANESLLRKLLFRGVDAFVAI